MDDDICKICHTSIESNSIFEMEESLDLSEKDKHILKTSDDPIEDISNQFNQSMNIGSTSPIFKVRRTTIKLVVKSGKIVPNRCLNIKKQAPSLLTKHLQAPSNCTFGDSKRSVVLKEIIRQKAQYAKKEAKILGNKIRELEKSGDLDCQSKRGALIDEALERVREYCRKVNKIEYIVKSGRCLTSESVKNRRSISVEPIKNRRPTSVEPMKNRLYITVEPMGPENRVAVEPIEHNRSFSTETIENRGHLTEDPMEDIAHQFKSKVNIGANYNSVMSKDDHNKMIEECRKTIKATNPHHGFIETKDQAEGKNHNFLDRQQLKHGSWVMVKRPHSLSKHEKMSAVLQKYREYHVSLLKRLHANINKNLTTS